MQIADLTKKQHMPFRYFILILLVTLNIARHNGQTNEIDDIFKINCYFTILREGPCRDAAHGIYVITNAFDFEDYWKRAFGPGEVHEFEAHWASVFGPPVKIPNVGFDSYMVVAIHIGGSGLCTLKVESVCETRDKIIIDLKMLQSVNRTTNISRRCIVIKMKKTYKPIEIV